MQNESKTKHSKKQNTPKMKIFFALILGLVTPVVTAIQNEQRTLRRHDDHETHQVVDEDEADGLYKTFIVTSSTISVTQEQVKQSRRRTRRLRPKSRAKSGKSDKSSGPSITPPNGNGPTSAPTIDQDSPTSAPSVERSTRDADYFVNFPNGFLCDPTVPFFMDRNVNPSTAFNGQYPQLIPNGFNPNCTLRMLPDTPADVATSAMHSFSFKPGNTDMRFRMQVGKLLFRYLFNVIGWHS
jgi:hypothetical protein